MSVEDAIDDVIAGLALGDMADIGESSLAWNVQSIVRHRRDPAKGVPSATVTTGNEVLFAARSEGFELPGYFSIPRFECSCPPWLIIASGESISAVIPMIRWVGRPGGSGAPTTRRSRTSWDDDENEDDDDNPANRRWRVVS